MRTITTNATPAQAREATGIIEWAKTDTGSTWSVDAPGIAASVVASLRKAGHEARSRKALSAEAETVMSVIDRIGAARRAKQEASDALKALLAELPEPELFRRAQGLGVPDALIAERAACGRIWVSNRAGEPA